MSSTGVSEQVVSRWLTVDEARQRAQCGRRPIYRGVNSGKLKAVRANARGDLRFKAEWIDEWLMAKIIEV